VWLNRADQALYQAKSQGRNQVVNAARPLPVIGRGAIDEADSA
jgi:hypothetical protein